MCCKQEGSPEESAMRSKLQMCNAYGLPKINKSNIEMNPSRPIANMFPHTTVLFSDIAGFTSWSSAWDLSQVFTLLETIYNAFDETIGDCYVVAIRGLPE